MLVLLADEDSVPLVLSDSLGQKQSSLKDKIRCLIKLEIG